jgi:hypothetical protein
LTFLRNHARDIWAVDFLQTYDLFFRTLFVFVVIELDSRRLVHFGVTRSPDDAWVAQQLREATPFGEGPCFLIRDNDNKYGSAFARVADGSSIEVLTTPYQAPKANAVCERFLGSVRRECLNFFLILGEQHLGKIMEQYQLYFNHARPHQGIHQRIPCPAEQSEEQATRGEILWQPEASSSVSPSSVVCITTISGEQPLDPHSLALPEGQKRDSFPPQPLSNTTAYNEVAFSQGLLVDRRRTRELR